MTSAHFFSISDHKISGGLKLSPASPIKHGSEKEESVSWSGAPFSLRGAFP